MRICLLGATGLVGRESLGLVERAWPGATVMLYASRDQTLEIGGKSHPVFAASRLEEAGQAGGDLALVALDDAHSLRYVPRLLQLGFRVVDKSNTYRSDPEIPLGVAGVNSEIVTAATPLVANPNCTTIPFTLAVAPLARRWGLKSATVSTYQAISGAGLAPLDEFLESTTATYSSSRGDRRRMGLEFHPKAYPANVVPHAGGTDDSGFSSEERKLVFESKKILDLPSLSISAQCCRVPVACGHFENAWMTLTEPADLGEVTAILGDAIRAPFVRFIPGPEGDGLSSLACVHDRDRALVGRVRRDLRDDTGRSFCITIAGDNLRLGAATNAVRIASRWFPSQDPELQA